MKKRTEDEAGALLADIPEKAVKKKSVASKPVRQPSAAGKGGYAKGLATGILLLVILISAALAGMYFNIGGLATQTLQILKLDAAEAQIRENRALELDRQTNELDAANTTLNLEKKTLDKTRKDLDKRELDIKAKEDALKVLSAGLSAEQANLDGVVAIYEAMEPAKAAAVLAVSADKSLLVRVLKNMTQTRVSQILGQMDAVKAAELLALLAGSPAGGQTT